jgi:multidrug efflux pump subunit AcrA (membrane-fusion protein)
MRQSRLVMVVLALAILLGAFAFVMLREDPPASSKPKLATRSPEAASSSSATLPVQTLPVQRRDLARTLTLPGNVSPWLRALCTPKCPATRNR